MRVNGQSYRTIWVDPAEIAVVRVIDQRFLPFEFVIEDIRTVEQMVAAIRDMHVRGAPLIGAAGAYGLYLATVTGKDVQASAALLKSSRPTAVNLMYGVDAVFEAIQNVSSPSDRIQAAFAAAQRFTEDCVDQCRKIGEHGVKIIEEIARRKKGQRVNILTHCNAGWLACVDYGTATAPIYAAFDRGIDLHVWVDETRPRNQGARLTAFELGQHGVAHTVIPDNTGGHLMQHGLVDLVIVGSDRTTRAGDVANKIGTYLKALAAKDNHVPFYAALPSSTIDWSMSDGVKDIPIETRGEREVKFVEGLVDGKIRDVLLMPDQSPVVNYGFDVTPARLVTGIITERGLSAANQESLLKLFPEKC